MNESPQDRYKNFGMNYNPFGYGRLGNYELDYMGAAEFEWGAIPDSAKRLAEADSIMIGGYEVNGHGLIFLWITEDGEPFQDFEDWYTGSRHSCEKPYGFIEKLENRERKFGKDDTVIWWSLDDDVMWCFAPEKEGEKSHIEILLDTMPEAKNSLRSYRR
jgi:hypothetical protein